MPLPRRPEVLLRLIARTRADRDYLAAVRWKPVLYATFGLDPLAQLGIVDPELDAAVEAFRSHRLAHLDGLIAGYERALAELQPEPAPAKRARTRKAA
jgi:hypothetical protein